MPAKRKNLGWKELKQSGNERFKTGQYGEATELYSQAIKELEKTAKGKGLSVCFAHIIIKSSFSLSDCFVLSSSLSECRVDLSFFC